MGVAAVLRQRASGWIGKLIRPRQPEALPVRLDRRRVYVVPSRFGAFYAVLLLAMLLGALNYNNNPALLLALLLAATGLASLIFAHLQLSGLRIDAVSADPVAAGTTLRLQLACAAHDRRLRRGLCLEIDGQRARIPAFTDATVAEVDLPTERRGWFALERIRLSTTQPLGLSLAWSWIWPDPPLLVYPAMEPHAPPLPEPAGNAQARLHPAGDEPHHLRPYRAGDARRAIAWKSSARRNALMVREYEQRHGTDLLLDWFALAPLPGELRIARLAAWIDQAEREGRRYTLRLPGVPPLGPDLGPPHRHACLRELALLPG